MSKSPIILALDTDDLETASAWIGATKESIGIYKIGLEFYLKFGALGINYLRDHNDFELFLDLKLHDIPNTVANAVKSVSHLNPSFLTVHGSGGGKMVAAAADAAPHIAITAVTVLTSMNQGDLESIGIANSPLSLAQSIAKTAITQGAKAIVCSPLEVCAIRALTDGSVSLITPGVRPLDSQLGDQSRVMDPRAAMAAGATHLVIGRPITSLHRVSLQAMSEKAAEILESIS